MGCSIKPQFKKVPTKLEPPNHVVVQPGNFVLENEHSFQDVYRLGKLLGTGTFGEVRVCAHRSSLIKRAVKIIRKDLLTSAHHRETLDNEIKILKSLDHPNIIRVYEFFEEVKRLYIVMEYCKGGELFSEIVERGGLSESCSACIMKQIFLTLEYLKKLGVVHRDLKPENILLEEKHDITNIKIIDFGTALILNETGVKIKGNAGTVFYMSPEVFDGMYTVSCDMWSAGIIMYIMLSGYPPFDGKNNQEIMESIKQGSFSLTNNPWPNISDSAKALINQLLCKEEVRLTPEEALKHKWIIANNKNSVHESKVTKTLNNLRDFRSTSILRDAIKTYITTQYISASDIKDLKEVFMSIDANHDGKISGSELINEYSKIMDEEEAKDLVEKIIKEVDLDKNGYIDYSEFLRANLDNKKVLSEEHLTAAFRLFDHDGNGKISAEEMKRILEGERALDASIWSKVIQEFDVNGDGEIDIEEFGLLLKTITPSLALAL
ncbi:hypothetical protein SteCoe_3639 [Stentor coeruleus]|uniref:non-specific serine/threonine protein kinase n=1 Tax=Stentor coeruleus TaxID=5963 RepID=A0A1R2CWL1_9CILI|nr:hypothetical protein SteCoe_3639 [Stentor coeruleus]